jgi:segregation and condensation protein A
MGYAVSTPVFEGPFDLLLHLILQEEVDLWEVSLARIVDAFLAEVETLGEMDLEVATEFLLIAATLVELKARRLLPDAEDLELDEELLRFEERDLLLGRLLECKTFKDAARALETRLRLARRSIWRSAGPEEPFRSLAPDPLSAVSMRSFHAAALRALVPKPVPVVDLDHVQPNRVSVRDAVETVLALLPDRAPISFRELSEGAVERLEVIVRFLALLELYKQGVLDIVQAESFADLTVRRLEDGESALDRLNVDDWGEETAESVRSERAQANRLERAEARRAEREARTAEGRTVDGLAAADEPDSVDDPAHHRIDAR